MTPIWPPDAAEARSSCNATPLKEELPVEPQPHQQVVDLAYRADGRPTALVAAALAAGCPVVVDGLEILVRQGAASFERWTGIPAPVDVMRAAVAGGASAEAGLGGPRAAIRYARGTDTYDRGRIPRPGAGRDRDGLPAGFVWTRRPSTTTSGDASRDTAAARDRSSSRTRSRSLTGLRHGLHAGNAAHARRPEPRPQELAFGMSPWPPDGEPEGKGTKAVTLPGPAMPTSPAS